MDLIVIKQLNMMSCLFINDKMENKNDSKKMYCKFKF